MIKFHQNMVNILFLSSPLLLRISPNAFGFIAIPCMYLSSLNRSIYQCFWHIMPSSAPLCAIVHSYPTDLP